MRNLAGIRVRGDARAATGAAGSKNPLRQGKLKLIPDPPG